MADTVGTRPKEERRDHGGTPPAMPAQRSWWRRARQSSIPYLFLAPNMIIFVLFSIWPAFYSLYISLFSTSPYRAAEYVGLGNYGELLREDLFRTSLVNSIVYVTAFTVIVTAAAVVAAVLLNARIRAKGVFRAAFFLPFLLSPAVVGLVWQWILQRDVGLLNIVLEGLGIPAQPWLLDGTMAMVSIVIVGVWIHLGFFALIILAGLQSISPTLYEAADIDGASPFAQFRYLTLPLLVPSIMVVVILSVIGGFKAFDYIFVLTGGGPVNATTLMVQYIYKKGFEQVQFGLGAAASMTLFVIVFALTIVQYAFGRRREAI